MKKTFYYTTRMLSLIFLIPAIIIGTPSLFFLIVSDLLDPDPYDIKK